MASQILYGLTPVLLARQLGPRDYGIYSLVMSLAGFAVSVFCLGQNSALHKFIPEYSANDRSRGGAIVADILLLSWLMTVIFCTILFLLAGQVASKFYQDASLTNVFEFCALLILALSLFSLASSTVAGLQDFRTYNNILLLRSLSLLGLAAAGAWLFRLHGALVAQLLAGLLGFALLATRGLHLVRERFPGLVRPVLSKELLSVIISFILPTLLVTLVSGPAYWWANTLLARHAGFEEVGLFAAAYGLSQLIMLVPANLYIPAMTFLSEAHANPQSEAFVRLVSTNFRFIWALTLPLALGSALLAPPLIQFFFGRAYLAAAPLAFLMSFAALLAVLVGLMNTTLAASGRMWHGFAIALGWAAVFTTAGILCIPRWGAMGSAAIFVLSYGLHMIALCVYVSLVLQVAHQRITRLSALTTLGFAAAAGIALTCQGITLYAVVTLLLMGLMALEWVWICGVTERNALRQGAVWFSESCRAVFGWQSR
ncbi:MAG: oligosaccharide flippase family protein [Acidobacteria bacterium]|nr:oligosaccharide flippase family protein [Acidobacteriota bacterium]MCI0719224.1 oligosaccharide flippase family protein [Acidobacteriota bacterium]